MVGSMIDGIAGGVAPYQAVVVDEKGGSELAVCRSSRF